MGVCKNVIFLKGVVLEKGWERTPDLTSRAPILSSYKKKPSLLIYGRSILVPWIDVLTLYSVEPNMDSLVCNTIEVNNSRCRRRVVISPCCIIRFLHYWLSTPASLLLYLPLRLLDVVHACPLRALIVTDVAAQRTPTLWMDLQSNIQHWWTIHHWLATSASLLLYLLLGLLDVSALRALIVTDVAAQRTPTL